MQIQAETKNETPEVYRPQRKLMPRIKLLTRTVRIQLELDSHWLIDCLQCVSILVHIWYAYCIILFTAAFKDRRPPYIQLELLVQR